MASPYQVSPPQGNLIGSIMDFISQNRQLQLDAGTRNQINGEQGFGPNVDPFAVQKYATGEQQLKVVGDTNTRANQEQQWQGADRQSQVNTMQALSQSSYIQNDPILRGLFGNAGANSTLGAGGIRMLGDQRESGYRREDNKADAQMRYDLQMQGGNHQHQQALARIKAEMEGRAGGGRLSAQEQVLQSIQDAFAHKAATDSANWPGGDRSKIQQLELAGAIPGRDSATVMAEIAADAEYNKPGGKGEQDRLNAQREAEEVRVLEAAKGDGAKPQQAVDSGVGMFTVTPEILTQMNQDPQIAQQTRQQMAAKRQAAINSVLQAINSVGQKFEQYSPY